MILASTRAASFCRAGREHADDVTVPVSERRPCLLGFDLVAEGVRWFEKAGSKPVTVTIDR